MTTKIPIPPKLALAGFLAAPLFVSAQAPSTARPSPDEDMITLSPFVIQSERDTGYRATSTLAGSRLNTPLSDIGASVSVLTKDLIDDLGATSLNDLLIYAGGTEASGINGNFSGNVDFGEGQTVGFADRSSPQDATRARGLSSPTRTRNYFITSVPTDAYNVESVTVVRGPNSVLFGAGSPSGVVESSLLKADVNRNRTKIEFRFGDNNSERGLIDHNQLILHGKLAVRVAALRDRERYDQKPAFEDKERYFGTVTYNPFRSTSLRVNAEYGKHFANRPIATLPFNSVPTAWFREGMPFADWRIYDNDPNSNGSPTDGSRPRTGEYGWWTGQFQNFRMVHFMWDQPNAVSPSIIMNGRLERGFPALNPPIPAEFNADGRDDNLYIVTTGNVGEVNGNLPFVSSGLPEFANGRPTGIQFQGFTNYDAFDFRRKMIDATGRFTDRFRTLNVALEQRAWEDRVGVQVEYDWQGYERRNRAPFLSGGNQNHIRVDVTRTLPNGQVNPNFGRPLILGGTNPVAGHTETDVETLRATAYLKYDFKDLNESLGTWLGSHTLTGLVERFNQKRLNYELIQSLVGNPGFYTTTVSDLQGFSRRPAYFMYIGPSVYQTGGRLVLEQLQSPIPNGGDTFNATYYNWDRGQILTEQTRVAETVNNGGSLSEEEIATQAAVLQSYTLDNHLVTLFGMRKDEPKFGSRTLNTGVSTALSLDDQYALARRSYSFDDINFPLVDRLGKTTKTYSAVLKWPQKLLKLPAGTDLSFFFNKSENFSPSGATRDIFLNVLPSPTGTTEEYGFAVSLFQDKFYLRANRYETNAENSTNASGVMATAINNGLLQRAQIWLSDTRVDRTADADKLLAAYPDLLNQVTWRVTTNATTGARTATFTNPASNNGDTSSTAAKGYEFELTYNPTQNWRITANVAKQEAVRTNLLPRTRAIIDRMRPIWASLGVIGADIYQLGEGPGNVLPNNNFQTWVNSNILVPFAQAVALEGANSPELREWRVNVITNYTFSNSSLFLPMLKGVNVGGGARYQSKASVGFPVSVDSSGATIVSIDRPYWGDEEIAVDAWIGYRRKIFDDRVDWKIQLNATNLTTGSDPITVRAQPWGAPAIVRVPPEKRWYVTNTFTF